MNKRAVSTQVGVVLMLSITILAIGLIYTGAYPAIKNYIVINHQQEVVSSFKLLRSSLMKITSIGIPSRVIETKIYEGAYTIKPTGNITVGNRTIQMYSLVYENYPFYLAMENGALFRKTNGNYTILEPPFIVTSGNTTIVAVIELYGDLATAGKGVLRIRLSNLENVRQNITTNSTITVQSSHMDAWKDFFESAGFQIQGYDHANRTVIVEMNTSDMFVVKVVPVRMEFLR